MGIGLFFGGIRQEKYMLAEAHGVGKKNGIRI
jgi:hypothetical protein